MRKIKKSHCCGPATIKDVWMECDPDIVECVSALDCPEGTICMDGLCIDDSNPSYFYVDVNGGKDVRVLNPSYNEYSISFEFYSKIRHLIHSTDKVTNQIAEELMIDYEKSQA